MACGGGVCAASVPVVDHGSRCAELHGTGLTPTEVSVSVPVPGGAEWSSRGRSDCPTMVGLARSSGCWPSDVNSGGRIAALAQLRPEDVPVFFAEAERIAKELASEPVGEDEYNRVVEPLRQYVSRASTGNLFWLYQLEGATVDSRRVPMLRYLLADYTQTPPAELQALAQKYFASREAWRLAVIPQGQDLAKSAPAGDAGSGR